jgi:hypothetical protein
MPMLLKNKPMLAENRPMFLEIQPIKYSGTKKGI